MRSRRQNPTHWLWPLALLAALSAFDGKIGSAARIILPIYLTGITIWLLVIIGDYVWQDRYWLMAVLTGKPADHQKSRVRALFDSYAKDFDRELCDDLGYRGPEIAADLLRDYAKPSASFDAADLGCGTGLAATQFHPWTKSLIGCDLSAKMLAKAKKRGFYDQLEHKDLAEFLQTHQKQFDLIIALDVLIYIEDPWRFYVHAYRACKDQGYLLITTEIAENQAIDRIRGRRRETRDVTVSLAVAAGFELTAENIDVLRYEAGSPVKAGIYLFHRSTSKEAH